MDPLDTESPRCATDHPIRLITNSLSLCPNNPPFGHPRNYHQGCSLNLHYRTPSWLTTQFPRGSHIRGKTSDHLTPIILLIEPCEGSPRAPSLLPRLQLQVTTRLSMDPLSLNPALTIYRLSTHPLRGPRQRPGNLHHSTVSAAVAKVPRATSASARASGTPYSDCAGPAHRLRDKPGVARSELGQSLRRHHFDYRARVAADSIRSQETWPRLSPAVFWAPPPCHTSP